jgi:hypothetical protein
MCRDVKLSTLGVLQTRSGRFGEQRNLLPLTGMKLRFLGRRIPGHSANDTFPHLHGGTEETHEYRQSG